MHTLGSREGPSAVRSVPNMGSCTHSRKEVKSGPFEQDPRTAKTSIWLLPHFSFLQSGQREGGGMWERHYLSPADRGHPAVQESQLILIKLGKLGAALRNANFWDLRIGEQQPGIIFNQDLMGGGV